MSAHCTVVIPTKNAMPFFTSVLEMVLAQKTQWKYDVIVIDSGSKDGTTEFVRDYHSDVRLIEIASEEFGHGRTRNLGIKASNSQFIAFLTHDAMPSNEDWLANLVSAMEADENIAGCFGRHVAHEFASPFTKRDLDLLFKSFLKHPLVLSKDIDQKKYHTDIRWQQLLHFYSDNNSIMRRSVWERIPYPDVEFAEDQLWAKAIIDAGYSKAYAPDAIVSHSHDYNPLEQFRRAFDESSNFKRYFGYRLSPSFVKTVLSSSKAAALAFYESVDENAYGKVTLLHRARRSITRAMLAHGYFWGTHYEKLPALINRHLSQDKRLFRA